MQQPHEGVSEIMPQEVQEVDVPQPEAVISDANPSSDNPCTGSEGQITNQPSNSPASNNASNSAGSSGYNNLNHPFNRPHPLDLRFSTSTAGFYQSNRPVTTNQQNQTGNTEATNQPVLPPESSIQSPTPSIPLTEQTLNPQLYPIDENPAFGNSSTNSQTGRTTSPEK